MNGDKSSPCEVHSGVSQGIVLVTLNSDIIYFNYQINQYWYQSKTLTDTIASGCTLVSKYNKIKG